jgi:hypothetical protein
MQHHRHPFLATLAAFALAIPPAIPANAAAPDPDGEVAVATLPVATWIAVEAHTKDGATGAAAILVGIAREREPSWQAVLRADCFDRATTVRIESPALALRPGAGNVAVTARLDGGPFRPAPWRVSPDGKSLELTGNAAVAFLTGLYGKRELQLAIVRPMSVPFVLTFTVADAENGLALVAKRGGWGAAPALSEANP